MRTLLFILLSFAILVVFHLFRDPFVYVPHTGIGYALGVLGALCLIESARYYSRKKIFNIHRPTRRYIYELHIFMGWWALLFGLLHADFHARGVIPQLLATALGATIVLGLVLAWFFRLYFAFFGYQIPTPKAQGVQMSIRYLHRVFTLLSLVLLFVHIVRSLR